ncbi:hypothetical protein [Pedobacter sp. L105]|uniref:hypothetical protein n=1 Tax=Pedobacter sp. L105 TaxID=1641871 RepID=UPI00131EC6B8|nr:hypothetical protein [Pedobacter sp. L105]
MAQLKISTVKASTLLEVIIAMVIILVVFSLAIGIYNNVLGSSTAAKTIRVNAMTDHLIRQSINENNWNDLDTLQDSINLKKTVVPYEKDTSLLQITITAFQQDKQIGQSRRIIKKMLK